MDIEHRCERIDELLPWYVNGSLDGEQEAVRAHLAGCDRCRAEAEWLSAIGAQLRADASRPARDTPFSTLLQHIAADDHRRQRSHLALAAALLLTIAVTLGLLLSWQPLAPRYHTVTDAVPAADRVVLVELELAPHAPLSSLYDILERHGAVVAAGPDTQGRLRLEFPLHGSEDVAGLVRELQSEATVTRATLLRGQGASPASGE